MADFAIAQQSDLTTPHGEERSHATSSSSPRRPPASPRASVTPTGWAPRAELELAEWVSQGKRLGASGRGVGWWIGDWLRYGNERFGERYVRASRITGYDTQTLMNMVYVASRFEISRRREMLSWSHHAELAALESEEQDRWLTISERESLSVRCLREEMRRRRRHADDPGRPRLTANRQKEVVCPACGCRFDQELEREPLPAGPVEQPQPAAA